jgi:hypothetical protein
MVYDSDISSMYPATSFERSLIQNQKYIMRVLNKKYWPHHVTLGPTKIEQAERWCYDNFKSSEWRNVGTYFAFKQGADATVFTLRWA